MSFVYDQKKIDALASELMEPQRLADGGPPDVPPTSKFRKAAAAVQAARSIGDEPLEGAPTRANVPNIGEVMLGKNREAEEAARRASAMSGVPYRPTTRFAPLDVDRATRIAREYDLMKHDPDDPLVKMAYEQMIKETNDQYEAMLQAGIEPYFIEPGSNTYRNSPYEVLLDVAENRRLGVFPSVEGFGTDPNFNPQGNPLLQETGRLISGRPALANDLFRAVHDYFGHAKPGVGFRAAGEENAYQSHAGMFSPLARRALASETRGQNSYLNYGPYGETNRTAKIEDTRFADQKAGLMPRWASEAGLVINDDRRREFFDNLARNQTGLEGAISDDGKLRLVHYSSRPLERINPEFYGQGLSRFSRAERNRSYDPEFVKRSYYGIPASEKPYVPEFGLGGIRNEVLIEPELIYQAQANPEGLWLPNDPTGSERRIAEAGYTGYYSTDPKLGKVAVIFDPYDVSKSYMIPVGAVGAGAMAMSGEDDPEGMSKGGLVDKLRSAASSVKEAGNVYKAAVGNMFSPFEPVEPQLGDPNDYEFPELRLRRPGIVNLAVGMPNMAADLRDLFGSVKDVAIGDEVPDESWRRFDIASEAQGRYEEDMDKFLRSYTGKSMDELSGPMSAVLGVSEALAQPGIISAKAVAGLPRLARYLSNITEFATPVTVASPGAMLTGATVNAGIRALPSMPLREMLGADELSELDEKYAAIENPQRIPIYRNEPEFIDRAKNPENYPQIENADGSYSSHMMAAEVDESGNWYVFPTIQMQPDGTLRQYDDPREAMKAAFLTGNILRAPNKESALNYAEGGYKVGTPMEPKQLAGGGLIDRINQSFYENISKPAVGTAIDMTLGLGDLAQMAARYLGNKAGFDAGEFTSVAQPVKEAIGVEDYNPYTIGGVGASILPFAAAGRTAQAINAAPAGVRQIQAALPNLGRESAAYVGAEAAGAGAREFMPDSPMAELVANVAGGMGGSALGSQPTSMGIIKEKGGNWLAGSIEHELERLHSANQGMLPDTPANQLAELEKLTSRRDLFPPDVIQELDSEMANLRSKAHIDKWIDSKLHKYIRNEMATESDPIRALAERDILHVNPSEVGFNRYNADDLRQVYGYGAKGESGAARAWEDATDVSIRPEMAMNKLQYGTGAEIEQNPWLSKIPPESLVYDMRQRGYSQPNFRALGFDHLLDELRNATRINSDLPENLRVDAGKLDRMTVPQIVEKVSEINRYRMAEAERSELTGMMDNLNAAPRLADDSLQLSFVEKPGGTWLDIPETIDDDGLKVCTSIGKSGGWCTQDTDTAGDYGSGENRLTALVDAEGRPHAQAQISEPYLGDIDQLFRSLDSQTKAEYGQYVREWRQRNPDVEGELESENVIQALREAGVEFPPDISQLMPVGNSFGSARAREYIRRDPEYVNKVTDSVLKLLNSQRWGEVANLSDYGIVRIDRQSDLANQLRASGVMDFPEFVTQDQLTKILRDNRYDTLKSAPRLAKGGSVTAGGLVYDANRINALAAQLMEPVRLSEGGPPPRSRIARAAAAVRGAATPPREIPDEQRVSDEEMMRIARDLGIDVDETIIPSDAPIQPARRTGYGRSTIRGAGRKTIPGIYDDPREIVERASRAVAPESEAMQQLFGVTREDLADIAMSRAPTNYLPPGAPARPRGTDYAELVMQPANTNRLVDILGESLDSPLRPGMTGWYIFDPVYNRLKELVGEDEAQKMFLDLNTLTGVHSANAAVANELTRGSAMNWLNREGRLDDYLRFGGKAGLPGSPIDMATIPGHMAHKTAHVVPALRYLETGELSREAKTPAYIASSTPPELGTNINFPVGDAHFVRGIGLSDVRPETKDPTSRFASWSMPEAMQLSDWFARDVARRAGLPGVPGQALLWGALSPTTGVKSKIGAPKLEILSDLIMQTANRLRITPEEARDMVLTGKAYAGKAEGGLAKYSKMMRGV